MKTQYLDTVIEIDELCKLYRGSFGLGGELAEPENIRKVVNFLKGRNNPILLDVGACTGSYALLDKLVDVQVYSFEPVLKTFAVMQKNIQLNGSKTKAFNFAVSNYNGIGDLKTVGHDGAIALSLLDGNPYFTRRNIKKSKIKVVTIDKWCEDNNIIPDFIKIDVEGGEIRVIHGAENIISKHSPGILCEYSQENANQFGYQIGEITKFLQGYRYSFKYLGADILAIK
jgi:FkbM family methyltransferase